MEITSRPQRYGLAVASLACGIIACAFNLLFFTAFIGVPLSIIAVVLGASSYRNHQYGKAGLVLGLLAFLVVIVYACSYLTVVWSDPLV